MNAHWKHNSKIMNPQEQKSEQMGAQEGGDETGSVTTSLQPRESDEPHSKSSTVVCTSSVTHSSSGTDTANEPSQRDDDVECAKANTEAQKTAVEPESDANSGMKICCTRRNLVIAVAVLIVLGVLVATLGPKLLPVLTQKKAINALEVTDATAKVLRKLNPYISVIAAAFTIDITTHEPISDEDVLSEDIDLGWTRTAVSSENEYGWTPLEIVHEDSESRDVTSTLYVERARVSQGFSFDIIPKDDILGISEIKTLTELLLDCRYLPMKDNIHYFESDEDRQDVVEDLRLLPLGIHDGYLLPKPVHEWKELLSDEALSRMFWYGLGAVLIMGPEFSELYEGDDLVGFEIDLLDISSFPVRGAFQPYGFRIRFDLDQTITSIYDPAQDELVFPGDGGEWAKAKFQVKQTIGTVVTIREHLQWSHLLASNTLTRANILHLPPNHPIRRLLSIFTFGANKSSTNGKELLTPEKGMFHRMSAFEYSGFEKLFDTGYVASDIFRPFRDAEVSQGVLALAEQGMFPYYTEGLAFYRIVHKLVNAWLVHAGDASGDAYALAFYKELVVSSKGQRYEVPPYSKENMVDEIAQLIWAVTAYHEFVGTVAEYTQRPDFMGFRVVQGGKLETDTEAFLLAAYLTGVAVLEMPQLMGDFPNFIGQGDGSREWEVGVWSDFQQDLRAQSAAVKAADAARIAAGQPEFKLMDPEQFECSASV